MNSSLTCRLLKRLFEQKDNQYVNFCKKTKISLIVKKTNIVITKIKLTQIGNTCLTTTCTSFENTITLTEK